MNGFIVVDKPVGITSHDVVSRVRRIMGIRKVGHTGTLDPFATGVLPIAINDATKAINYLDEGLKKYDAIMRLGVVTDSLDMTGKVLKEVELFAISVQQLQNICIRFTGKLFQIPPMYSAIKQDGQPLYKLARQGIEVERKLRPVEIYSLEILSINIPFVSMRVCCSRGTYVRTLADDIGRELGCGAALQELRRTASGLFSIEHAVTLNELESAKKTGTAGRLTISPYHALGHLPDISLNESGIKKLSFGIAPDWSDTISGTPQFNPLTTLIRLSNNSTLAAVAELLPQFEQPSRIVLKRVFVR